MFSHKTCSYCNYKGYYTANAVTPCFLFYYNLRNQESLSQSRSSHQYYQTNIILPTLATLYPLPPNPVHSEASHPLPPH